MQLDVAIIGAGPSGLSCAIEAKKHGLSYLLVEKGGIADAIRRFPVNMIFFSTPELLELEDLPFTSVAVRPTRQEVLNYYRRVVKHFDLEIRLHSTAKKIIKHENNFEIFLGDNEKISARYVILATGYFDYPNRIGVPGEDLAHVSHHYDEPYRYANSKVVVVGGQNSAVEAALELFRHGAEVTLIHRGATLGDSVKYWIRPDIENRIKSGEIRALFNTELKEIGESTVSLRNSTTPLPADFIFLLTGYRPDENLLTDAGVRVDTTTRIPEHDQLTYQTNVNGFYVAGSIACGCETSSIFIENGRLHAKEIFRSILNSPNG